MRSIRFSVGARPIPKSFHRGTFWLHLLGDKRWKILALEMPILTAFDGMTRKIFAVHRTARAAASAPRRHATAFASLRSPQAAARNSHRTQKEPSEHVGQLFFVTA
ncbi:hypothetical protein D1647_00525 [Alistipes sp. Z76]|nr:hypothetical protein [Alistipes sp. Z76]NCE66858.1 hypothetical protein [Muribaculaceae bacterium M3]